MAKGTNGVAAICQGAPRDIGESEGMNLAAKERKDHSAAKPQPKIEDCERQILKCEP
jgi:hypothetical protein